MLSSKTREESRRVRNENDERSSLMTHEYDTVYTGDQLSLSSSVSQSQRGHTRPSPHREIESEYSEIRRDFISNRNSRSPCSRSITPTDNPLVSGVRGEVASYGAVAGETDSRPYSYIGVEKERRGRQVTPGSVSDQPPPASDVDGSESGHPPRTRVTTSIFQVGERYHVAQSGEYLSTFHALINALATSFLLFFLPTACLRFSLPHVPCYFCPQSQKHRQSGKYVPTTVSILKLPLQL